MRAMSPPFLQRLSSILSLVDEESVMSQSDREHFLSPLYS